MRVVVYFVGILVSGVATAHLSAGPPKKLTPINVGTFMQEFSTAYSTDDGLPSATA